VENRNNLSNLDINQFITDSQVVKSILFQNPQLMVKELIRVIFVNEVDYLGLIQISKLYLILNKREVTYTSFSIYKATKELYRQFSEYIDLQNWRNIKNTIQ
jgi:hypothetical protein